jgi:D-sedoheptulose 7-phosphate isomerase
MRLNAGSGGAGPGWPEDLDRAGEVLAYVRDQLQPLGQAAGVLIGVLAQGGIVLSCGNGGSALQAQHLASELIGRFRQDRRPLRALALSADPGVVTGIANDYGYQEVFARQLAAFDGPAALVAFSTSGNSPNVVRALDEARARNMATILLTGADGGAGASLAEHVFRVPAVDTARIQEGHLLLLHLLCERIDDAFRG